MTAAPPKPNFHSDNEDLESRQIQYKKKKANANLVRPKSNKIGHSPTTDIFLDSPNGIDLTSSAPSDPEDAIKYFNIRLKEFTVQSSPMEWALCQLSLGLFYCIDLDERTARNNSNIENALGHLKKSSLVFSSSDFKGMWGIVCTANGKLYREQAKALYYTSLHRSGMTNRALTSTSSAAGVTVPAGMTAPPGAEQIDNTSSSKGMGVVLKLIGQSMDNLSSASEVFSLNRKFLCEYAAVCASIGSLYLFHAEVTITKILKQVHLQDLKAAAQGGSTPSATGVPLTRPGTAGGQKAATKVKTEKQVQQEIVHLLEQALWYLENAITIVHEYEQIFPEYTSAQARPMTGTDASKNRDGDRGVGKSSKASRRKGRGSRTSGYEDADEDDEVLEPSELWNPFSEGSEETIPLHLEALLGTDSLVTFEYLCMHRVGMTYFLLGETSEAMERDAARLEEVNSGRAGAQLGTMRGDGSVHKGTPSSEYFHQSFSHFWKVVRKPKIDQDSREWMECYYYLAILTLNHPGLVTEFGINIKKTKRKSASSANLTTGSATAVGNGKGNIDTDRDVELKSGIEWMDKALASELCKDDELRRGHFVCSLLHNARVSLRLKPNLPFARSETSGVSTTPQRPREGSVVDTVFGDEEGLSLLRNAEAQIADTKETLKNSARTSSNIYMYYYCFMKLAEYRFLLCKYDSNLETSQQIAYRQDCVQFLFNAQKWRSPVDNLELHFIAVSQLGHTLSPRRPLASLRCYIRAIQCLSVICAKCQYLHPMSLNASITLNPDRIFGLVTRRIGVAITLLHCITNWILPSKIISGSGGSALIWKFQFDARKKRQVVGGSVSGGEDDDYDEDQGDDESSNEESVKQYDSEDPDEKSMTRRVVNDYTDEGYSQPQRYSNDSEQAPPPGADHIPFAPPGVPVPARPPSMILRPGTGGGVRDSRTTTSSVPAPLSVGSKPMGYLLSSRPAVNTVDVTRGKYPVVSSPVTSLTFTLLHRFSRLQLILRAHRLNLLSGQRARDCRYRLPSSTLTDVANVQKLLLEYENGIGYLSFQDIQNGHYKDMETLFESKEKLFKLLDTYESVFINDIPKYLNGDRFLSHVSSLPAMKSLQNDYLNKYFKDMQTVLGNKDEYESPDEEIQDKALETDEQTRDEVLSMLCQLLSISNVEDMLTDESQAILVLHIGEGSSCLRAVLIWFEEDYSAVDMDVGVEEVADPGNRKFSTQSLLDMVGRAIPSRTFSNANNTSAGGIVGMTTDASRVVTKEIKEKLNTGLGIVQSFLQNNNTDKSKIKYRLRLETACSELDVSQLCGLVQMYVESLTARSAPRRASMVTDALKEISDALGISEILFPLLPSNRPVGARPVQDLSICCPALLRILPWSALTVTTSLPEGSIPVDKSNASTSSHMNNKANVSQHILLELFSVRMGPSLALTTIIADQRKALTKYSKSSRVATRLCCLEGERSSASLQNGRLEIEALASVWCNDYDKPKFKPASKSEDSVSMVEGGNEGEERSKGKDTSEREDTEEAEEGDETLIFDTCDVLVDEKSSIDKLNTKNISFHQNHDTEKYDIANKLRQTFNTNGNAPQAISTKKEDGSENPISAVENSSGHGSENKTENALYSCRVLHISAHVSRESIVIAQNQQNNSTAKKSTNNKVSGTNNSVTDDIGLQMNDSVSSPESSPLLTARIIGQQLNFHNCSLAVLSRSSFGSIFVPDLASKAKLISNADAVWDLLEAFHLAGVCTLLYPLWGIEAGGRAGLFGHTLMMIRFYCELKRNLSEKDTQSDLKKNKEDVVNGVNQRKSLTLDDPPAEPTPAVAASSSPSESLPVVKPEAKDVKQAGSKGRGPIKFPTASEALRRAQLWLRNATVLDIVTFISSCSLPDHVKDELSHELNELAGLNGRHSPQPTHSTGEDINSPLNNLSSNRQKSNANKTGPDEKKLFTNILHWGGMGISGDGGAVYLNIYELSPQKAIENQLKILAEEEEKRKSIVKDISNLGLKAEPDDNDHELSKVENRGIGHHSITNFVTNIRKMTAPMLKYSVSAEDPNNPQEAAGNKPARQENKANLSKDAAVLHLHQEGGEEDDAHDTDKEGGNVDKSLGTDSGDKKQNHLSLSSFNQTLVQITQKASMLPNRAAQNRSKTQATTPQNVDNIVEEKVEDSATTEKKCVIS